MHDQADQLRELVREAVDRDGRTRARRSVVVLTGAQPTRRRHDHRLRLGPRAGHASARQVMLIDANFDAPAGRRRLQHATPPARSPTCSPARAARSKCSPTRTKTSASSPARPPPTPRRSTPKLLRTLPKRAGGFMPPVRRRAHRRRRRHEPLDRPPVAARPSGAAGHHARLERDPRRLRRGQALAVRSPRRQARSSCSPAATPPSTPPACTPALPPRASASSLAQ